MQGGHQVAQKFSTTTCPRNWLSVTVWSESCTVKSGAVEPMRAGMVAAVAAGEESGKGRSAIQWQEERSSHTAIIAKNQWVFQVRRHNPKSRLPRSRSSFPPGMKRSSLGECLQSLVAQTGVAFEIIVVDDGSTDRTREIAENFAGVQVISPGPLPPGWTGKNNAVIAGAGVARGEWLLFTDADTVHLPGSLARALAEAKSKAPIYCRIRRSKWSGVLGEGRDAGGVCGTCRRISAREGA